MPRKEACLYRLVAAVVPRRRCRRLYRLFALEDADEGADFGYSYVVAALDGKDDLFAFAGVVVVLQRKQSSGSAPCSQGGHKRLNSADAASWSDLFQRVLPPARIARFPASKLAAKASSRVRWIRVILKFNDLRRTLIF